MDFLVSTQVAEKALEVLVTESDDDGYVSATGGGVGSRIGVSRAQGARALAFLAHHGAIEIVQKGSRAGAAVYRVLRAPNAEVLRTVPIVA